MQLTLDFSAGPIVPDPGKKTERITVTCSAEFKEFIELICRISGRSVSEACHAFILHGAQEAIARIFLAQPHLDKKLRDILRKKF